MARKKKKGPEGAPDWLVTYGDMMSLLLCFFVIIVSMSEIKKEDRFLQVLESIRAAFGYDSSLGQLPTNTPVKNSLIQQLVQIILPQYRKNQGDSDEISIRAKQVRVTNIREGTHIEIGGRISFDRFSAVLKPGAEAQIAQLAAKIEGYNTILEITGHATHEPLPPDSIYGDPWGLSYARARAVGDALEMHGVRPERLRLIAAGDAAPLEAQAYDEETLAANRRVEIVVTEALVQEYEGRLYTGEERE
ncbi:MAG: flagellar motor protein MotB [Phycisphaerae bacterium]|nr:flagellar motor protein MotB [Phycisphaerae bacterium]